MKTKVSKSLFFFILTLCISCSSGPSGLFINKSDDGYVMHGNSLNIQGEQISAKYQTAGVQTFGGQLVQIINWNYYVNNNIGKAFSDIVDCSGTLKQINESTYSITWTDCTPQSATLKWDGGNKVTKITKMPDGTIAQADYYYANNDIVR